MISSLACVVTSPDRLVTTRFTAEATQLRLFVVLDANEVGVDVRVAALLTACEFDAVVGDIK